eukprot:3091234-Rhodomonas_salina.2
MGADIYGGGQLCVQGQPPRLCAQQSAGGLLASRLLVPQPAICFRMISYVFWYLDPFCIGTVLLSCSLIHAPRSLVGLER